MKILLTAFDPFGGESVNPAEKALQKVKDTVCGAEIVKIVVPTVFGESVRKVTGAISQERPDAVLCIGQAGGRSCVTPEWVAINVSDARIPDNKGNMPKDEPVVSGAEDAHFATLPVKKMVEKIREKGIPSVVSYTAGTFVCNHLMYGVLDYVKNNCPTVKAGFMHVPYLREQVLDKGNMPFMSEDDIVTAIEAAVEAIVCSQ